MSGLLATVSQIESCDTLHIVKFAIYDQILTMMSLELHQDIKVGSDVLLAFKPTHIAIAKELTGFLSYSNQFEATIESIENGELLSSVKLRFFDTVLESIITKASSQRLHLQIGDRVTALIKASEISIGEVICV